MRKIFIFILNFIIVLNIFSSIPIYERKIDPKSSADSECMELSYQMNYDFQNKTDTFRDNFQIALCINGTNGLLDQGTINYSLSKNPQEEPFIQALLWHFELTSEMMFFPIDFSSTHYQTYFSNRKESFSSDCSDGNSTYTLFWINCNNNPIQENAVNQIVPFFEVSSPTRFAIQEQQVDVAYNSMSPEVQELEKNTPLLSAYFLKYSAYIKDNLDLKIQLYYDVNWTVLLYAHIKYILLNPIVHTEIEVDLILDEYSLPFSFKTENPYWIAAQSRFYTILILSLFGVAIIIGIIYYRRVKKKNINK